MITAMRVVKLTSSIISALLLTSCQSMPKDCISLITTLQKKSFEKSDQNDYFISKVNLFSNPTCYRYNGTKWNYREWIPCTYSVEVNPDGSTKSDLGVIWCNKVEGCNDSTTIRQSYILDKLWKIYSVKSKDSYISRSSSDYSDRKLLDKIQKYYYFDGGEKFDFVHSTNFHNRDTAIAAVPYYLADEGLIQKNDNSMQCKSYASTSRGQSDTFFFSTDKWGKWSITPEHSGTVQIEMQTY